MYNTIVTSLLMINVITAMPYDHPKLFARKAPSSHGDAPLNAYLRKISMNYLERLKEAISRHTPAAVSATKRSSESSLNIRELESKYHAILGQLKKAVEKDGGVSDIWERQVDDKDGRWGRDFSESSNSLLRSRSLKNKLNNQNGGLWGRSLENNGDKPTGNGLWGRSIETNGDKPQDGMWGRSIEINGDKPQDGMWGRSIEINGDNPQDGMWGRSIEIKRAPGDDEGLWGRSVEHSNEEAFLLKVKRIGQKH